MRIRTWFERLTGFAEDSVPDPRAHLRVEDGWLVSQATGQRWGIGRLELPSLAELRLRAGPRSRGRRTRVRNIVADVRALHRDPAFAGALFQVASQFNLLEMIGPSVTPADGVTRYQHDRTQGPACAMAAGAATIYRNYLVPVGSQLGQTADLQIDTLAAVGERLGALLGQPPSALWTMRNGYALATEEGLSDLAAWLRDADEGERDALRERLQIGWHRGVEVTDIDEPPRPRVSQALCSALPVAYSPWPATQWEPFARLVLEAAYESTLLAALIEADEGGSSTVLLTRLGGGAFGNGEGWIDDAIDRAVCQMADAGLDVVLVHFHAAPASAVALEAAWS